MLHVMAIVQLRHDAPSCAYYRRGLVDGKTSMEVMRCLKRRLSEVVYRRMVRDLEGALPHTGEDELGQLLAPVYG